MLSSPESKEIYARVLDIIAAMGREMNLDVDLGSLPGDEAQRLHGMLTDANFFDIPEVSNLMARPDEYEHTIRVVAGNSMHTVHVTDTNMPESLHPLVKELTELAKAATGTKRQSYAILY